MSQFKVEPYMPKNVVKDVAEGARTSDQRLYQPGFMTDAQNIRYRSPNGAYGVGENILGNTLINFALGAGTNKCIGKFPYERESTIIYFIWNSGGFHKIIEFNVQTQAFQVLLADASLGFDQNRLITQGGVVDDLLIWLDILPYQISITRARAAFYVAPYSKYLLSLATRPPLESPTIAIVTDMAVPINNIVRTTWQFACQFVYIDNKKSTYGPLSKIAWVRPYTNPADTVSNAIDVTTVFPAALVGIVKEINFAYREGNVGNYFVFDSEVNPTAGSKTKRFSNTGKSIAVSTQEQNQLEDNIPDLANALEVVEGRIFTTLNKVGFNTDGIYDISLALGFEDAADPDTSRGGMSDYVNKRYLKMGGSYGVGIVFSDDFGKESFVKVNKSIDVPWENPGTFTHRYFITWTITGAPPAGFTKYRIVLTRDKFYATYFQCLAIPHYYVRNLGPNEDDNKDDGDFYNWKGKRFLKLNKVVATKDYDTLYLQLPTNVPFVPDASCLIRFEGNIPLTYANVEGMVGEFMAVNNAKGDGFTFPPLAIGSPIPWLSYAATGKFIEVLVPATSQEEIFYETGNDYNITAGAFSVLTDRLDGDTYNIALTTEGSLRYSKITTGSFDQLQVTGIGVAEEGIKVESPTGVFTGGLLISSPLTIVQIHKRNTDISEVLSGAAIGGQVKVTDITSTTIDQFILTLDYNKISSDFGRAHVVFREEKQRDLYSVAGFSSPYIQNSFINGLNKFFAENQYTISIERGVIRGFARAQNVLLAIHERFTSSLYIAQGFVKQTGDVEGFILTKTDKIVGDDQSLKQGFGTINPESIIKVDSYVWWWDALRGVVVQYSQAGLDPISRHGMKNYFYMKSRQYFKYRNSIKIVTGFDFQNSELLITFPEVIDGMLTIPAETWAYSTTDNIWLCRYTYYPEMFAQSGDFLFTFKNGQIWQNNINQTRNNFFGQQFTRKIRLVANPELNKEKKLLNIHHKGPIATDPTSDAFIPVRIYTPEGQESFIPCPDFERDALDEGKWCAPVLKNINTPGDWTGKLALRSGDDIVSSYFEIEIENDRTDAARLEQINVVYKTEEFSI